MTHPASQFVLVIARLAVRLAAQAVRDPARRARCAEQWTADVDGAAELGLSPLSVAFGANLAAARLALVHRPAGRGTMMMPIGPLAIVLRHIGGEGVRTRAALLTTVLGVFLLAGVVLLLAG